MLPKMALEKWLVTHESCQWRAEDPHYRGVSDTLASTPPKLQSIIGDVKPLKTSKRENLLPLLK